MSDKSGTANLSEEERAFNRRFKYAVIAYAIIEFIAIVIVMYYKIKR